MCHFRIWWKTHQMVCAISEKPKIWTTRYFSLTDFKNNLVCQSAAIRWLDSSGIEAVNAAAGGTFGRLRLTFSTLSSQREEEIIGRDLIPI